MPGPLRARLLGLVGSRVGLSGAEIGLVSVVVVPEEGDRVEDCLASVRGQTHPLLDVVVSPVGVAAAERPEDPRFRSIAPSATSYDAVRAGIAAAAGRYVVLVRGCDRLLPHAVTDLAGSLSASGSDLATGVLEQTGEPEPWLVRAQADAHAEPGSARPAPPALAGDLTLANKAFTRDLARRLQLDAGDDWLCSPALAGLLPGLVVDVLDRPVARYAWGRGHRAFGARPEPAAGAGRVADPARRGDAPRWSGQPLAAGWLPALVRRAPAALRGGRRTCRRGDLGAPRRPESRCRTGSTCGRRREACWAWPRTDGARRRRRWPPSSSRWATTSRPS